MHCAGRGPRHARKNRLDRRAGPPRGARPLDGFLLRSPSLGARSVRPDPRNPGCTASRDRGAPEFRRTWLRDRGRSPERAGRAPPGTRLSSADLLIERAFGGGPALGDEAADEGAEARDEVPREVML